MHKIPYGDRILYRGDDRLEAYRSDVVMRGDPEGVFRASNAKELAEILASSHQANLPVTFCGSRTSLTGSSVAEQGLLIATEGMNKVLDIDLQGDHATATAQSGIILAQFQDHLAENGFFYPPDPTSRKEACLGATVATNATGEDSLLYGSTRCYVRRLKVLLGDGTERELVRSVHSKPGKEKNQGGYLLDAEEIDLFIGSEGTLGLIVEVTVDLIRDPPPFFSGMAFFPSWRSALKFVIRANQSRFLQPRCLEIMDKNCLSILQGNPECFSIPANSEAALYFKQEYWSDKEQELQVDHWLRELSLHLRQDQAADLIDSALVTDERNKKEIFRDLRHLVPSTINELATRYWDEGGGKIGTDWWIPLNHLEQALDLALSEGRELGFPTYLFGHIGNGHPHLNFMVRNSDEKRKAREVVHRQCRRAVRWGGGVSGEHGIGKIKHDLLTVQHLPKTIKRMMEMKRRYDPHWILGQNNLFPVSKVLPLL